MLLLYFVPKRIRKYVKLLALTIFFIAVCILAFCFYVINNISFGTRVFTTKDNLADPHRIYLILKNESVFSFTVQDIQVKTEKGIIKACETDLPIDIQPDEEVELLTYLGDNLHFDRFSMWLLLKIFYIPLKIPLKM